jgi:peptidoglycan-associated lipoprotein
MNKTTRILFAALVATSFAACSSKPKKDEPPPPPEQTSHEATTTKQSTDGRFRPEDLESNACLRTRVVYFDFDRADIKPESQAAMNCHGKYLHDNPSARVTLEGHADERGTREYNLGLGERRGNAASGALQANGGAAGQLTVVSYGEERPTCNEHGEPCWGRNRRVEIVYTAK